MTVADERTPLLPSLASTSTSATASTATTPLVTPLEGEDDLQAVTAIPDSKRHTAVTEAGGDVVHERPRPLKESMSRPRFVLIL
jgi:hypothetical protein